MKITAFALALAFSLSVSAVEPVPLTHPWFEAEFFGEVTATTLKRQGSKIDGAQGVILWCPCGFGDPKYAALDGPRPHRLIVPFANPRNAPPIPIPSAMGDRPRWQMTGTGLGDLTVSPSVNAGCWHGWIQGGKVR